MPSRKRARKNPPSEPAKDVIHRENSKETPPPEESTAVSVVAGGVKDGAKGSNVENTGKKAKERAESSNRTTEPSAPPGGSDTPRSTRSWYGGTWPRTPKAAPVAQIVNDSVTATGASLAKAAAKARSIKDSPKQTLRTSSSLYHLSPGISTRSLPVTATTTNLNVSSDVSAPSEDDKKSVNSSKDKNSTTKTVSKAASSVPDNDVSKQEEEETATKLTAAEPTTDKNTNNKLTVASQQAQSQGTWLGWFGSTETKKVETSKSIMDKNETSAGLPPASSHAAVAPDNVPVKSGEQRKNVESAKLVKDDTNAVTSPDQRRNSDPSPKPLVEDFEEKEAQNRSSWLGLWGGSRSRPVQKRATVLQSEASTSEMAMRSSESLPVGKAAEERRDSAEIEFARRAIGKSVSDSNDSGGGWAFWSRAPNNFSKEDGLPKENGQLAVAGSLTEFQPEEASLGSKGVPKPGNVTGKRARPISAAGPQEEEVRSKAKDPPKATVTDSVGNTSVGVSSSDKPSALRPTSKKDATDNLLLPLFKQTYASEPDRLSLLQHIGRLLYGKPPPAKHPTLIKDPSRIKNALAIGVHGYFPMPIIQTVLGRPTGTSVKFAESAANAIHRFTQDQGYTLKSVEKIALEGEGKIEERLDLLWKLLLNWIDKIREADFILIACHSQGVPVAISLVAKLIGFGCVNGARIGICAMAGVNLGPFADYKSRWIGGSAGELFEFARPDSQVSKGYETALDTVLRFGAKVVYVGSLDDQLVSLHSSTFGVAQHPNIYRAVWIDGRMHVPDFLTHLVGFALKLRNLGVSDHGLIRELSNPLAGSLVGGEGHSRIYEDSAVYDLAVEFVMETTSLSSDTLVVEKPSQIAPQNPYVLPFAMRGLLEEDFVRKELSDETLNLLKQFDDWKPTTKVLRDVKYRLEGIRSKL